MYKYPGTGTNILIKAFYSQTMSQAKTGQQYIVDLLNAIEKSSALSIEDMNELLMERSRGSLGALDCFCNTTPDKQQLSKFINILADNLTSQNFNKIINESSYFKDCMKALYEKNKLSSKDFALHNAYYIIEANKSSRQNSYEATAFYTLSNTMWRSKVLEAISNVKEQDKEKFRSMIMYKHPFFKDNMLMSSLGIYDDHIKEKRDFLIKAIDAINKSAVLSTEDMNELIMNKENDVTLLDFVSYKNQDKQQVRNFIDTLSKNLTSQNFNKIISESKWFQYVENDPKFEQYKNA